MLSNIIFAVFTCTSVIFIPFLWRLKPTHPDFLLLNPLTYITPIMHLLFMFTHCLFCSHRFLILLMKKGTNSMHYWSNTLHYGGRPSWVWRARSIQNMLFTYPFLPQKGKLSGPGSGSDFCLQCAEVEKWW